jgi:hypothetical protein
MPVTDAARGPGAADELRLPVAKSAKPGSVEAAVWLHPLMGGIQRIAQRVGAARAKELAALRRRYQARTLERWKFDGVLVTIRSEKSFFAVTRAIESSLQRFSVPKLMEYVTHADREGLEAYVDEISAPSKFSIFWEMEQGPTMRLAGIPIESKFYLVGNAVTARGLFRYTAAAGLGAPVRICVSQHDGEQTRIDVDQQSAFFSKFPEMAQLNVPELLDAELVKVFEDAAA